LVGPSGCGKTTTLKMINRLVEPTRGVVEVLGRDVRSVARHELRRGIGYVIQQGGLLPHKTVAGNIATVPSLLGWDRDHVRQRVAELVDLVGLDPAILGRYPAQLSGGQQQRVGVARALAADPPVLLMDEPYSAVDPVVRARLQGELLALQQRVRKTIVLVTHDVEEAIRLSGHSDDGRVAVLDVGGTLRQFGPPDELLANPANEFVERFLGRERALRRLGLMTAGDAARSGLAPPLGAPTVPASASLREVLDVLVSSGADSVAVVDGERPVGAVDMAAVTAALRERRPS
jgi:osmoprotectant transport system ATP-binding protein